MKQLIKSLLLSFVFWLWIINFSSAVNWVCTPTTSSATNIWISTSKARLVWSYIDWFTNWFRVWVFLSWDVYTESVLEKRLFAISDTSFLFWDNTWLPYLYISWDVQWYIPYYFLCDTLTSTRYIATNCSSQWIDLDSSDLSFLKSFFDTVENTDYWGYTYGNNSFDWISLALCVSSSFYGKSLCLQYSPIRDCYLTWSKWYSNLTFSTIPDNILWSPWSSFYSSWSNIPNQSIFDYMWVQPVYNTLYKEWYRQQMCYWWFAIDDLFWTWNSSFSNIQAWTWAFVFDLFSLYSWWSNFIDWYDNNYLDYLYLESFQDQYEYEKYIWKSKGLVWLWIVRNAYFWTWRSNFNTSKYKLFCEYVRDYSWLLDTHDDTPMWIIDNTLSEELINSIVWDINILIPVSWSSLDVMVQSLVEQGYLSWDFSSCMSWDSYASCFDESSYWDSIKWAYDTFNTVYDNFDFPWILPSYIIVWFFSILLLYYLRR